MPVILSKPGIYPDLAEADYHADPWPQGSLSCSGSKLLVPPGCPALYKFSRTTPRKPTDAMEFGTAAHREVLGKGWPYAVGKWDDWLTKPAQQWRKEQREAGKVPILPRQREQVLAMAAAIRTHPVASTLLTAEEVLAEHSFFWEDPETGIMLRSRFDAMRLPGQVVIADFKTAILAAPDEFARAAARLRYHMQHPMYCEAITHTLGDADPVFLFVVQEKTPPYLVAIYELDDEAVEAGMRLNARARREYARCAEAGEWPGYQPGETVTRISLPRWAL